MTARGAVTQQVQDRLAFAEDVARRAGVLALRYFRERDALVVETKGQQDVVSRADREVEELIRGALADRFPDDGFLGEETGGGGSYGQGPVWVVDPIDGTQCFLSGLPTWCVSIGLMVDGRIEAGVIVDPCADECFVGALGGGATCNGRPIAPADVSDFQAGLTEVGFSFRVPKAPTVSFIGRLIDAGGIYHRSGSGALGLAHVAAGRYIAYIEGHMNSWDSFAGAALVLAAGGWINDLTADDGVTDGAIVMASGCRLAERFYALAGEAGYDLPAPPPGFAR
ncbi:inositol monophosphatase [Thalassobaculum sp.]|uniref:inositol monophosphatase family protein n=1 Tax=Thalassobaculum sp. TaxID=2022740 RepID=UPI0032EEB727